MIWELRTTPVVPQIRKWLRGVDLASAALNGMCKLSGINKARNRRKAKWAAFVSILCPRFW